jgi:hypothetical protein
MTRHIINLGPDMLASFGEEPDPERLSDTANIPDNAEKVGTGVVGLVVTVNTEEPEFTEWGDFHGLAPRPDAVERAADPRAPGGYTLYHAWPVHNS